MSSSDSATLEFAWDPAKAATNLAKHGVTFTQAATVFADALAITVFDEAHSMFEERWFTLGIDSRGKLLAVSHTYSAAGATVARIRIISAREATRAERRQYEEARNEPCFKTNRECSSERMTTMGTPASPHDSADMPAEIDFTNGSRGKFFQPGVKLGLPVYLDAEVQDYLADRAKARGIEMGQLVNELLKKDIELIEAAK